MRRLSIIGVEDGRQPISNEDGKVCVVFNGEIYNYLDLRKTLEEAGHSFRTHSDTECIVHLYEEYGVDCLEKLRGMFAFALVDQREESLFIARDRLGIKPLHFSLRDGNLYFASEIKALLEILRPGRNDLNLDAVDAFFAYNYIPAPLTIFRSIHKLEPGHFLLCRQGKMEKHRYWDVRFRPQHGRSMDSFAEEFQERFEETVRIHLMSEVPLGAFLSGGTDSSSVVSFMSRNLEHPVNTFTMHFGGDTGDYFDERGYARAVANLYRCRYNEYRVDPGIEDIISGIVESFDEPFADDSVIPTFRICDLAKSQVTVALTGLGGDELFGGYDRYAGFLLTGMNPLRTFRGASRILGGLAQWIPEPAGGERVSKVKRFLNAQGLPAAECYRSLITSIPEENRRSLYSKDTSQQISFQCARDLGVLHFNGADAEDPLDRAFYQDLKMYLPDDLLALNDRIGMHHSLELRVPFVDHEIVEFAASIPREMKVGLTGRKIILRHAMRGILPPEILSHRKQGFASPLTSWIRSGLNQYVKETLSPQRIRRAGILNEESVMRLIDRHMDRKENNYKIIFSLLMFQKWTDRYLS